MNYGNKLTVLLCSGIATAFLVARGAFLSSVDQEEIGYKVCSACTDVYDLRIRLYMPRIYDNMQSLGYRKYQSQTIVGQMYVDYSTDSPTITFSTFTNKTYKIGGKPVTYEMVLKDDSPSCLALIGDNKKNKFKTTSVAFFCEMLPSYNIGDDEPDNTLVLAFGGKGSTISWKGCRVPFTVHGYVSGTMGCGCMAYGHKSPTRNWAWCGFGEVTDIASTFGAFKMKLNKKRSRK